MVVVPSLKWVSIDGISGVMEGVQRSAVTVANRSLTFDPIRTSHGGSYTCQAEVTIPQAGISNLSNSAQKNVSVQSKPA